MKNCLVDVLNARDTVLHVFPVAVENQDVTPNLVDVEEEALRLAGVMQLLPETEILHARLHVSRGGQLTPYDDMSESRHTFWGTTEQRIRERAYFLWQQEGCSDNRADEHWYRARKLESNGGPN